MPGAEVVEGDPHAQAANGLEPGGGRVSPSISSVSTISSISRRSPGTPESASPAPQVGEVARALELARGDVHAHEALIEPALLGEIGEGPAQRQAKHLGHHA